MHVSNDIGSCRMLSVLMMVLLEMSRVPVLLMYSIYSASLYDMLINVISRLLTVFLKGMVCDRIANKFFLFHSKSLKGQTLVISAAGQAQVQIFLSWHTPPSPGIVLYIM